MDNNMNNQPHCPPRMVSYEKSKEHKNNYYSPGNNNNNTNPIQNTRRPGLNNNQNENVNRYSLVVGPNGQPKQYSQQRYSISQQQLQQISQPPSHNRNSIVVNHQNTPVSPSYPSYYQSNSGANIPITPKRDKNHKNVFTTNTTPSPYPPNLNSNANSYSNPKVNNTNPSHHLPSPKNANVVNQNTHPKPLNNNIYSKGGDISTQKIIDNKNVYPSQNVNPNINNNRISKMSSDSDFEIMDNDDKKEDNKFLNIIPNIKVMMIQSKISRWTIILSLIQFFIIIPLEVVIFVTFNKNYNIVKNLSTDEIENYKANQNLMNADLVYQILFIISQIFVVVLYYDSLRVSNSIQLIAIGFFNFLTACYSVIQFLQTNLVFNNFIKIGIPLSKDEFSRLKCLECIVIGVLFAFSITICILSYFLFRKFGWNIYRNVGADIKKTKILTRRHTFWLLLKFNAFFLVGIIIQSIIFQKKKDNNADDDEEVETLFTKVGIEILLPILGICFLIHIISGYAAITNEIKRPMIIFILSSLLFMAYTSYVLYVIFKNEYFKATRNFLSGFAIVELILLVVSIYYAIRAMIDFSYGKIDTSKKNDEKLRRRISL